MIQDFGSHILITSPRNSVMVERQGNYDHSFGVAFPQFANTDAVDHVFWGSMDNIPNAMKNLMRANHLIPSLLVAMRDLTFGNGLGFFERKITNNKLELIPYLDERLEDWAYETELDEYLYTALNHYFELGNVFARMTYDPLQDWFKIGISDGFMTRIKKPSANGKVDSYVVNPYFGDFLSMAPKASSTTIKAFDFASPERNKKNIVTILHCKDNVPGNPYYAYPTWWSAKEWIELANLIPVFHKNGIKNGYNIKYLIKVPKDYFDKEGNKPLDEGTIKRKWAEWSNNLSSWLSGEKNVNKSLIVKYLRGRDEKALDSISVEPIKNEMSDNAYSIVWEMADKSTANAVGLQPIIAGVSTGKGNDSSGAQIRSLADFQSNYRTSVIRKIILKPVLYSLREMGYKHIVPTFKDVQLTTLDANPNGKQAVVNQ